MGAASGPEIVNNNMALYFDMSNTLKSWKGLPTTNVVTNTDLDTGWSKDYCTSIQWNDYPPPFGIDSQVVSFIDSDGNGSGYWFSYGNYAPQEPSTTYCISIYARTIGQSWNIRGYTADNSEVGRQFTNTLTVPGDGNWYRLEYDSITTPADTQSDSLSFQFTSIPAGQRCWLCAPQMTPTSFHVPFVNGTRTNDQALLDLSGQTTITANNLTYYANGSFSLNGTNNFIATGRVKGTGTSTSSVSWCVWTRPKSLNGNIMSMSSVSPQSGWNMPPITVDSGKFRGKIWNNTYLYSSDFTLNQWYYVCLVFSYENSSQRLYVNGELVAEQTGIGYSSSGVDNYLFFGQANPGADNKGNYAGDIASCQVYNRALSANEIAQNFVATRSQYGI